MQVRDVMEYANGLRAEVLVTMPHGLFVLARSSGVMTRQYAACVGDDENWSFCFEESDDTPSHWRDSFTDVVADLELYCEQAGL